MSLIGRRLEGSAPAAARIRDLTTRAIPAERAPGFTIEPSEAEGRRRVSIPPDLPTCADCLREIFDPDDRRYRYPFTNCTNCGPRFTILRDLPSGRAATSMASFVMCAECRKEYDSPADRRFRAQPNGCPACGPRLRAISPRHEALPASDAISAAAAFLDADLIVAVKGIGGYYLACDATSSTAVSRLRHRMRRDDKPFAVMVRDVAAAEAVARLGTEEKALLTSAARPIVLVPRREDSGLAPETAPDGPLVGLLLPSSPLHHLLLAELDRPLVMTSGSLSGEPLAARDAEAFERLANVADVFLVHDREIETRCGDSVARIVAGRPTLLRRSRGYVPRPITLARPVEQPVLACGGHLKNAFCIAVEDAAYLGPHVGDLENPETVQAFDEAVERLEYLLGVWPEIVAHDLRPGPLSTAYALARPGPFKVAVAHNHAHVVSAMAEHRLSGGVLGVVYDAIAHRADASSWAGEILLADEVDFECLATFRPVRLPGAIGFGHVADAGEAGTYPFAVDWSSAPWTLDTQPMIAAALEDMRAGRSAAVISSRFQNTLAEATATILRAAVQRAGRIPVVLGGGCFENALLAERTLSALAPEFPVYLHHEVPAGDGGLALGQAVIADALTRSVVLGSGSFDSLIPAIARVNL